MVIRVSLALPRNLLAQGVESYLQQQPDIDLSPSSLDGHDAPTLTVDAVILMGLSASRPNALQRVQSQQVLHPRNPVVVLADFQQPGDVLGMLDAGAMACVSTDSHMDDVLRAIRCAARGSRYLCQQLSALALQGARQPRADGRDRHGLGHREEEVLRLIADGYSSKQIARHLEIAPSTVDVHRRNIMRKIGLHKVADLTRFAIRHQMVTL